MTLYYVPSTDATNFCEIPLIYIEVQELKQKVWLFNLPKPNKTGVEMGRYDGEVTFVQVKQALVLC